MLFFEHWLFSRRSHIKRAISISPGILGVLIDIGSGFPAHAKASKARLPSNQKSAAAIRGRKINKVAYGESDPGRRGTGAHR
jgi:hypothetical protein